MRQSHKTILLWGALLMMFYLVYSVVGTSRTTIQEENFSDFLSTIERGELEGTEVEIRNESEFL
ncbi:hypothetical protein KAI87_08655, partial [Myxococcota bacterium]|nr:hypothetical protein [Myxococcota bacterium]